MVDGVVNRMVEPKQGKKNEIKETVDQSIIHPK